MIILAVVLQWKEIADYFKEEISQSQLFAFIVCTFLFFKHRMLSFDHLTDQYFQHTIFPSYNIIICHKTCLKNDWFTYLAMSEIETICTVSIRPNLIPE